MVFWWRQILDCLWWPKNIEFDSFDCWSSKRKMKKKEKERKKEEKKNEWRRKLTDFRQIKIKRITETCVLSDTTFDEWESFCFRGVFFFEVKKFHRVDFSVLSTLFGLFPALWADRNHNCFSGKFKPGINPGPKISHTKLCFSANRELRISNPRFLIGGELGREKLKKSIVRNWQEFFSSPWKFFTFLPNLDWQNKRKCGKTKKTRKKILVNYGNIIIIIWDRLSRNVILLK